MKIRSSLLALALSVGASIFAALPVAARESGGETAALVSPLAPPAAAQGGSSTGNPQKGGVGGFEGRFTAYERNAPDREGRTHISVGTEHVNVIFGGMSQGAGVPLGVQLTTADDIPGVELSVAGIVTTKLYRQFEGEVYFPSVGGEATHADLKFRYRRRTKDNFFGIGPDVNPSTFALTLPGEPPIYFTIPTSSSEDFETNYDLEQRMVVGSLFHDFTDRFQAGVYVSYETSDVYRGQDEEERPITAFFTPYYGPGIFQPYPFPPPTINIPVFNPVPGLARGSEILSEGIYAEYDARSSDDGLPRGFYAYARVANNDGLGDEGIPNVPPAFQQNLNDFGWVNFTFDVRGYVPLFSDRTSLALRYYTELNGIKGASAIPFYELARLGGGSTLRGFDTFRFHGRNAALVQGELRQRITTFTHDELEASVDAVFFADAGEVWGSAIGRDATNTFVIPVVESFDTDNVEADFGGGIHVGVSDFTLRLEVAHSNEKTRFIVGFNRAF